MRWLRTLSGLAAIGTAAACYRGEQKRLKALQMSSKRWNVFDEAEKRRKRVVVIGAGVIGVSTAYKLAQRNFDVVVLESAAEPGEECSLVAAGGMQRSNPIVDRNTFLTVTKSLLSTPKSQAFFHLDWTAVVTDPQFYRWFTGFAWSSWKHSDTGDAASVSPEQSHMLNFTSWAISETQKTMVQLGIEKRCGFSRAGAMQLKFASSPFGEASNATKKSSLSLEPARMLTPEEAIEIEPNLEPLRDSLASVRFEHEAAMGDSFEFTEALVEECKKLGVRFEFGSNVRGFRVDDGVVSGVSTSKGMIELDRSDNLVVAAGSWTPRLLWHMGLFTPMYPMKGYSVIMDLPKLGDSTRLPENVLPHRIISDSVMYTSRLGDRVRMASMGELCGWNTSVNDEVDAAFRARAEQQQPRLAEMIRRTSTKCGLRPFVSDGLILLGQLPGVSNAFVNIGPGFNGWKLSVGSGEVIARLIDNADPNEGWEGDAKSLSPAGRVKAAPIWSRLCLARWE